MTAKHFTVFIPTIGIGDLPCYSHSGSTLHRVGNGDVNLFQKLYSQKTKPVKYQGF